MATSSVHRVRFRGSGRVRLLGPRGDLLRPYLADRPRLRLLGLALLRDIPADGLLLPRCSSVHTVGMRAPIDVLFLGGDLPTSAQTPSAEGVPAQPSGPSPLELLSLRAAVRPSRVVSSPRSNRRQVTVLELPAGRAAALGLEPGVVLHALLPARG